MLLAIAALVLAAAQPTGGDGEGGLAPDGRRGLGSPTTVDKLLRQFRTPDEAEALLHKELYDLVRDVGVLVALAEGFYRERGYFDLLEPLQDPTLANLHAQFRRYARDPSSIASRGDRRAEAFARMFLDPRFRVRMRVIEGFEHETRQVLGGLDVLAVAANGLVSLDDVGASAIAWRVDLAAAHLRSVNSDLASLREPMDAAQATGPGPEEVQGFLALFDIGNRTEREKRVAEAIAREEEGAERMIAVLSSTRLLEKAAADYAARAEDDARSEALLEEASAALPGDSDAETPREIAQLSKSKRRRLAREKAILGLTFDPLNDELAWIAAEASRLVFGELEMASHYDRYLALHGIVHFDGRTYRGRRLTERETNALYYVQEYARTRQGETGNQ